MPRLGEGLLEALLRTASEGVVVQDEHGTIVFCNRAAEQILGVAEGQILGTTSKGLEDSTTREDGTPFPATAHPAMVTLRTGEPCEGVLMGIQHGPRQERRWISINSALLPRHSGSARMVLAVFADITPHIDAKLELHRAVEALRITETSLRNVLSTIPDDLWIKDKNGVYLFCNPSFETFYGARAADIIGHTDFDFSHRVQAELFRASDLEAIEAGGPIKRQRSVIVPGDGRHAIMETIKTPMRDAAGELVGVLGIARDMTERIRAERELARLTTYQRALLDNTPIGISVFRPDRVCIEANDALARIFGIGVADLIGANARVLYRDQASYEDVGARAWPVVNTGATYAEDVPMQRLDGTPIWVRITAHLVDTQDPEFGAIMAMEDITERRRLEDELRSTNAELQKLTRELQEQARTDPLTGLPNRRAFQETIEVEFGRSKRFGTAAAIMVIDIDHFKQVNDTHGHDAGDRALICLAAVLKTKIRASDLAARFGGEEFVMLLPGTGLDGALILAERIRVAAAAIEVAVGDRMFGLTVSVGVAPFVADDYEWQQALVRADRGLYRAKLMGRNRVECEDLHVALDGAEADQTAAPLVSYSKHAPKRPV
jgi:diguanylate cyclase (GGDEF)-like protein/PAS domain S-box-containing protein